MRLVLHRSNLRTTKGQKTIMEKHTNYNKINVSGMVWTLCGVCRAVCCDPRMEALRVTGVGRSCDLSSRSQYRGVGALGSVGSQTLIFHYGTGRNVDSVSVVGYDDEDTDSGRCRSVMWFCLQITWHKGFSGPGSEGFQTLFCFPTWSQPECRFGLHGWLW